MNCIFESFNKKEAMANPFLQQNKDDPGRFTFPTTGVGIAQAAQASKPFSGTTSGVGSEPSSNIFKSFTHSQSLFSTPLQLTQPNPLQSLFTTPQPQSIFTTQSLSNNFNTFHVSDANNTSVRLTKHTSKIKIEKVLALLSSEIYIKDDISTVSQLNPSCDVNDVTKVAPLAIAAFVDESVMIPITKLPMLHVKFLQDLILETFKTEEDMWKSVTELAISYGLYNVVQYINAARTCRTISIQQYNITSEVAFVLAVHAFITNNDKPHDVMRMSWRYSKETAKLAADMCMASYGLNWVLDTQTHSYINKHKDTYILSC